MKKTEYKLLKTKIKRFVKKYGWPKFMVDKILLWTWEIKNITVL